jgi:hypothetical protein
VPGAGPNPCAAELAQSALPFSARYADFTVLDVRAKHQQARRWLAGRLSNDEWGEWTPKEINQVAFHSPIDTSSS